MDTQDDPNSETQTDNNEPASLVAASSPKPRKKRVAIHSPEDTPPQITLPTPMEVDNSHNFTILKPTVLALRFTEKTPTETRKLTSTNTGTPHHYAPMTQEEARSITTGDQWKEIWDHPQIIEELTAEPEAPNPAEILQYEFDKEDPTTRNILRSLNVLQLESSMRTHVLGAKNQDRSRMHPRFSPFTLAPHDKDTAKALVINCKGDRAHTFKLNDLKLDCAGTNFDLDDHATHSTLCFLAPNLLWDDLLAVTGTDVATKEPPNGPYKILHNRETDNSISFQDKAGKIWNSSLSTDTCNTSTPWNTATKGLKQSASQAKDPDQISKHQATPNQNRFAILADTDTLDSPADRTDTSAPETIKVSRHVNAWVDDDSDGEAAHSGDENSARLEVTQNHHSNITSPAASTALSSLSDPHAHSDGENGQYLINVEFQLVPGQEHTETLFHKMRELLKYIQQADPTAELLSRTTLPNGTPHPSLSSPTDKNWPTSFLAAQNWIYTSMDYLFKLPPITEKQLQTRLNARYHRDNLPTEPPLSKAKTEKIEKDKGPVSMYITLRLRTAIPQFDSLLTSVNIDLRKFNIKVARKPLQSWDSKPRKLLCSVNAGLCTDGVKQLLLHQLKEMEKRLCRHGKRNTLDWYDTPLPDITVTLRGLRPLRLPKEEVQQHSLSFDPFPWDSRLVYHIETDDGAWQRLAPLFDYLTETNIIAHTFGPAAYLLDAPSPSLSLDKVRAYHKHGRISIGYNLATTIIECNDVQIYDYDVKVAMAETDELDKEGNPTGNKITPKPPYAKTNLRRELQRFRLNGEQLFHTAVMTCKGPDTGTSRIVIAYDPSDPARQKKYNFAKTTITNLACFMFHWWKLCGYNESTRQRLMRSFHLEKTQLAEFSTWDHRTTTAIPQFNNRRDTYLTTFAYYDPGHAKKQSNQEDANPNLLDISDEVRASLIKHLGNKQQSHNDVGSHISGASTHTNASDMSTSSTVNSDNSINRTLRTKDIALQRASSRAKEAEQEQIIRSLKLQMEQLQRTRHEADSQQQQGTPPSVEAEPPPDDQGGGEALQGL